LDNFHIAKDTPYVFDYQLINRSLKLYREQNHNTTISLQQCNFWQKKPLNEIQLLQVKEIRISTKEILNTNNQILALLQNFKDKTIDALLEKDDIEFALDFFQHQINNYDK